MVIFIIIIITTLRFVYIHTYIHTYILMYNKVTWEKIRETYFFHEISYFVVVFSKVTLELFYLLVSEVPITLRVGIYEVS